MIKSYSNIMLCCVMLLSGGACYAAEQKASNSEVRDLFASIKRLREREEESVQNFSKYLYAIRVYTPEDDAVKQHLLHSFLTWQHMRSRTNTQVDAVEKLVSPRDSG